ncbi:hypothetical protein Drose_04485 [Dactylosporangium roseum]|uniref:Uncharacterized protein n=1 Tax=Dactylosporangium roseum TaxID=47989 RepID=A0ABY5Z6R1_9ACTN|nr:hypothetical protein [Dactylosporangium roseum]UWZ37547.1 hypothetical protein Drose_04485 [Dactylosporangium roseum]
MTERITYEFSDEGIGKALTALGTTEQAIATNLSAMGHKGLVGSESNDPVARYVRDVIPRARSVEVYLDPVRGDAHVIAFDGQGNAVAADLPLPVQAFVTSFDMGKYPNLISEEFDAA